MPSYEELKQELAVISEILRKYPESLQSQVFRVLLDTYLGEHVPSDDGTYQPVTEIQQQVTQQSSTRKKAPSKEAYKILGELNLAGGNGIPSFREFNDGKQPQTNLEFNTLAIYYLERHLKLTGITLDHVYTCYRDVSRKIPTAFKQSLYDTSSRLGSIDAKDMNSISLTIRGENLVEHDLPQKKKAENTISELPPRTSE